MQYIVLLLIVAAAASHRHHSRREGSLVAMARRTLDPEDRPPLTIINGKPAHQGDIPYQAAVIIDGDIFCGGSLISNHIILTAAQCAYEGGSFTVYLGATLLFTPESGQVIVSTSSKVVHENYREDSFEYDIALLDLKEKVTFNSIIRSVTPASGSSSYAGDTASVSGWGRTSSGGKLSDQLHSVNLKVISNSECSSFYRQSIPKTALCASSSTGGGICNGDGGGPLVDTRTGEQIGIVSFGPKGCKQGYPDGFTRVSSFASWIKRNSGQYDLREEFDSSSESENESDYFDAYVSIS